MRASGPAVAAAIVLAAEGIALAVVCLLELFALGAGEASSTVGGIAMIVLTLLAAGALIAFAYGTLRRASWARSGAIVFQVLGIALGLASLSIDPVPWLFTLAVGGTGVVGLVLLIAAVRRDGGSDPRLQSRGYDGHDDLDD
ncbi:hypothetical protein FM104_07270 [Microbacterium esteraromaticum]|uniref:Uncharacterized protein n=1 Tax=Microbacterium esteraromaticum TaxID=57043 RepID=A0A1R4JG94_9MICO|nr:hypothetical protein [Microbacterium esteraromaticum]SJN31110.1 hypothetical protein FM104_07270 [Microbacterium esteraromaticum]